MLNKLIQMILYDNLLVIIKHLIIIKKNLNFIKLVCKLYKYLKCHLKSIIGIRKYNKLFI